MSQAGISVAAFQEKEIFVMLRPRPVDDHARSVIRFPELDSPDRVSDSCDFSPNRERWVVPRIDRIDRIDSRS